MPITAVSQWDGTTPGNNTDLNSITLVENQTLPSHVNGLFREMMKQIKAGVSANALMAAYSPASASSAAYLDFYEDTDNGSNRVRLIGPTSTADVTVTLPATTGTVALVAATFGVVRTQIFTASGTYTPHAKMVYCLIEAVGAGGGGGGVNASANVPASGAGGAGSYSSAIKTAAQIGASQTVTIGAGGAGGSAGSNNGAAGGDTSVGSLCIGKGGSGGAFAAAGAVGTGGLGGVAGTGDFTPTGEPGGGGGLQAATTNNEAGALGGNGPWGGGAGSANQNATGLSATSYGGGGGGATFTGTGTAAGGAGFAGVVKITEFCSE